MSSDGYQDAIDICLRQIKPGRSGLYNPEYPIDRLVDIPHISSLRPLSFINPVGFSAPQTQFVFYLLINVSITLKAGVIINDSYQRNFDYLTKGRSQAANQSASIL